jgi:hypothetical protein
MILLGTILENPGLAERLIEVLKSPAAAAVPSAKATTAKPKRRS